VISRQVTPARHRFLEACSSAVGYYAVAKYPPLVWARACGLVEPMPGREFAWRLTTKGRTLLRERTERSAARS